MPVLNQERLMPKKSSNTKEHFKIIINSDAPEECRIALVKNRRLEAFEVETKLHVQTRGNLYKGKVVNVEPGLQAAFVDIGLKRNAYLPLSEIHPEYHGYSQDKKDVSQLIKRGQEVLVQIVKEETPLKGAAVTTYLSIPGRYLVLMPGTNNFGVSRKIEDQEERKRLKEVLKSFKVPEGVGLIVRTVSQGIPKTMLSKDLRYLLRLWKAILKKVRTMPAPSLIYEDKDVVTRFLRDHLTADVKEIIVDNDKVFENIKAFLKIIAPRQLATVKLYNEEEPIFSKFGLEEQIDQIYQGQVSLPSGGFIVIEPTEALVAIDVNSGKSVQEKNIEETALKTNLEAADEIARQLRLRDLSGIIVIDFIDMRSRANRQKLEKRMRERLKIDKARTEIARISKFGILPLVRQKIGFPVELGSYHACPVCNGRGTVRSVDILSLSHLRRLRSAVANAKTKAGSRIILTVPLHVASYILNEKRAEILGLEQRYKVKINIEADTSLGVEEFKLEVKEEESQNEG